MVRTGSTDRHIVDDEPIDPQPPRRLRTYRDLDLFVKLLEPLMLLVMGVVILFIMIALLLPVFMSAGALG